MTNALSGPTRRAVLADGWTLLRDAYRLTVPPTQCTYDTGASHYRGCNAPAVVTGPRDQRRCQRHLGGRWIENGQVWTWTSSEDAS